MATWMLLPPFTPVEMSTAERDADFPEPPNHLVVYTLDALGSDIHHGRLQLYEVDRTNDAVWQNFLLTSDDRLQFPDVFFNMGQNFEDVTISAGGSVAATRTHLRIETNGGAGTDDLTGITGGVANDLLVIAPFSGSHTVVLKHASGGLDSIYMEDASELSLTEATDLVLLIRSGIGWHVIGRGALQARQHDHADVQGGGTVAILADDDGDTKIEVEQSADEDIIRMTTAGTERVRIEANGDVQGNFVKMLDIGAAMVQAAAPATPANGQVWLDTSTDATGTESLAVASKTSSYTATDSDAVILCDASAVAITVTLPTAVGRLGRVYRIKKIDSSPNIVTVDGDGSETIDDGTTAALTVQYEAITIISDGTEWWIL